MANYFPLIARSHNLTHELANSETTSIMGRDDFYGSTAGSPHAGVSDGSPCCIVDLLALSFH